MIGHWTNDIENMLIKLRLNSLLRSKYHKQSYFRMNAMLKYFRIPIIILSVLLSVFSMSTFYLQKYICSTMSIMISIISSIEMFLQIQKRMEIDLHNAKAFSALAAEITKIMNLEKENRNVDGLKFLDDKMNEYNSLVDMSIVTDIKLHEKLLGINLLHDITNEDEIQILKGANISQREYLSKTFTDEFYKGLIDTESKLREGLLSLSLPSYPNTDTDTDADADTTKIFYINNTGKSTTENPPSEQDVQNDFVEPLYHLSPAPSIVKRPTLFYRRNSQRWEPTMEAFPSPPSATPVLENPKELPDKYACSPREYKDERKML